MRFTLLSKHLLVYLFVAILGFAGVNYFCFRIDYNQIINQEASDMYRQAVTIASEYSGNVSETDQLEKAKIEKILSSTASLSNDRIVFVKNDGEITLDTDYLSCGQTHYYKISHFNPSDFGNDHKIVSNFYGYLKEDYLITYAPIVNSYVVNGYVLVTRSKSSIVDRVYTVFNTNYYTLMLMLILNLSFIILYTTNVHRPITQLSNVISEYGKGNFSYKTKIKYNDEFRLLASSLEYMADKINNLDEFQQAFLSNISHDFRSPLTSIKGYLEAIEDGTIPPEMTNKYINIILFETDRLTKLTNNILLLNELDPSSVKLELSDFDINSLIKHTLETFEGRRKKRHIKFDLTFEAEKEEVHADKVKIGQVIYNLIDNAIKFSKDNSQIYISVSETTDKARISIKDTGCGISKESIDKIFNRFYKSDTSRGRDKKGSGLGLAIVKEIVNAHGENIDVISTEGVGTEFVFTLKLV